MKKFTSFLLALVMIFSLVACGGSGSGDDPNLGVWTAVSVEMMGFSVDVADVFEKGFTIELKAKGKCTLVANGEKGNGKWSLENGVFKLEGGDMDCTGRLEKGRLTLEDVMGAGLTIVFEKDGGHPGFSATPEEVGYFVLEKISSGGEVMTGSEMEAAGVNYFIIIEENGTLEICTGVNIKGTWKDGVISYVEYGEEVVNEYTIQNDILTIQAEGDTELVFKRSSATPPPPGERGLTQEEMDSGDTDWSDVGSSGLSDELKWWESDWYGYWTIDMGSGDYADLEGYMWDCYAVIDAEEDGTALVHLWDDHMELGTVGIQIDVDGGVSYMGGATSEYGSMFMGEVGHANWIIRPGVGGTDEETLIIEARHDDGDYMDYKIVLRKWGMMWEDLAKDERPRGYDDWYIGEMRYIGDMLSEIADSSLDDGTALFIHPEVAGGAKNTSGNTGTSGGTDTSNSTSNSASSDSIVGVWEYDGGKYIYTFNADGTGAYNAGATPMPFTYETKDATLSILFDGNTAPTDSEYTCHDGILTIKDYFGNDVVYLKK